MSHDFERSLLAYLEVMSSTLASILTRLEGLDWAVHSTLDERQLNVVKGMTRQKTEERLLDQIRADLDQLPTTEEN